MDLESVFIRESIYDLDRRYHRLLVLILLVLIGVAIRIYIAKDYPVWNDEASIINAAIALKEAGSPVFPSGFEYWRSFPYTLTVAASSLLLGTSELALRMPSIILSGLSILVTYKLAEKMFTSSTGIIASTLMVFSNWHIAWTSQVTAYIMFQVIYITAIWTIYLFGETWKKIYLHLIFALSIVGVYTNITGYIVPIIFFSYIPYISKREKILDKKKLIVLALILSLIFLLVAPVSLENLLDRLSWQKNNPRFYYSLLFSKIPLILLFSTIGSIIGLKTNLRATLLLLISILPTSLVFILMVEGVSPRYLFFSLPLLAIWTGLTIEKISAKISAIFSKYNISAETLMTILTVSIVLFGLLSFSITDYRPDPVDRSVYEHLNQNAEESDTVITQWTPVMVYYFRPPDYVLYGDRAAIPLDTREDYQFNGSELYSGAAFIDTAEGLKEVIEQNERGWLVLTDNSFERKRSDVKEVISQLDQIGEFDSYRVWRWNDSFRVK